MLVFNFSFRIPRTYNKNVIAKVFHRKELERLIDENHEPVRFVQAKKKSTDSSQT